LPRRTPTTGTVTALEVARAAGVSRATVSRCFTTGATVKKATRNRVLAIARELGYEPNLLARMLIKQESNIVAVLTSDFTNPFQPALIEALTGSLRAAGMMPLLLKAQSPLEPGDELMQLALSYRVAAIIVTVLSASDHAIRRCFESETPVVLLNRIAEDSLAISVCGDQGAGGARLADILVEGGHTRIAVVSGRSGTWTNTHRRGAFRRRLDELDQDIWALENGNDTYEGGYEAALKLLANKRRPDAIYACNDAMAFGVMDAARNRFGLRIPDDVAVAGFDDVPMARWGAYRLSTIRQPITPLIDETMSILTAPDRGLDRTGLVSMIPGRYVQRATTRPVTLSEPDVDMREDEPTAAATDMG
jgi:DNA-binding LacI/PurR family transcriptional regulator